MAKKVAFSVIVIAFLFGLIPPFYTIFLFAFKMFLTTGSHGVNHE
jgi:hypothetical protein